MTERTLLESRSSVGQEIVSQPEVWAAAWRRLQDSRDRLSDLLASQCWDALFFTGSGSSHYLSLAAANLHQQLTGQRTLGIPSSEIALFPTGVYPDIIGQQILLVAVSRSGETTETLWAAAEQQRRHLPVLAITCDGQSGLAARSNVTVAIEEAAEPSVPQTRSFTSMFLATQYVAGLSAGNEDFLHALEQLPGKAREVLDRHANLLAEVADIAWDHVIFLGSGPFYGLANEGMLKLKEMALSASEAYHFLEFRHGPISLVDARTLVIGLLSDTAADAERAVLARVNELGGQTMVIGERPEGLLPATYPIALESGLHELARAPLYVLPLQLLAYDTALARGLDPAQPRHLERAVVLAEPQPAGRGAA